MTLRKIHYWLTIILVIFLLTGCDFSPKPGYNIVTIEGASSVGNMSTSYIYFVSVSESVEPLQSTIVVSDGDLLYLFHDDDLEFFFRYNSADGDHFNLSFDTLARNEIYLNDRLVSINLTDEEASWKRFETHTRSELEMLSVLKISGFITEERMNRLKAFEPELHGIGLVFEDVEQKDLLDLLLPICKPEWLLLLDSPAKINPNKASFLSSIELIWISGADLSSVNLLSYCSNLESIIINGWNPKPGELMDLNPLQELNSVTMAECGITDLSYVELPNSVERLFLIECDSLVDLTELNKNSNLHSLSLAGCDSVSNLELINDLPSLSWLSFPENISQEIFSSILQEQQVLQVIELNNCSGIKDLSILGNQDMLKALRLNQEEIDLTQLESLNHPALLVLNADIFKDAPEEIAALRTALPETEIVPGSGLCLGSGWLLLLLPLILLSRILFNRGKK